MKRTTTLAAAAAILIGGGAAYVYSQQSAAPGVTPFAVEAQEAQDGGEADLSLVKEMSIGNPDATVEVIEYASFTCPHCRDFHDTVYGKLKADYIDSDKIKFTYREVYFDRPGLWASMVARCGGEMRFFGIADLLYEQQRDWVQGAPAEIADHLRKIGKTAGLGEDQLDACLTDAEMAKALVASYQKNAEADDINSTPSFIINGEKFSNMSYEDFSKILDEKLAE